MNDTTVNDTTTTADRKVAAIIVAHAQAAIPSPLWTENQRLRAAVAELRARAEAAEAVADNMLNNLLPDTIRSIVLDLSAAEHQISHSGEFALLPQTLEFRNKCAAFLDAEWPDSAWDQEWPTALEVERSRRAYAQLDEVQP